LIQETYIKIDRDEPEIENMELNFSEIGLNSVV